ncbi:L-threonylcarbamoyladenylate synthase [Streptomyces sp. NPDC008001]|uniref:L-threonylcarbamoyladenylate synthase n=1 Tax=Streptomyces sp. NPDC008001 TaxID=3364804 RepID=UPI0036F1278D
MTLPTETVYGLGANAEDPAAVARTFPAKGRPPTHPLIVHIGSAGQLDDWAEERARHRAPAGRALLARPADPGPATRPARAPWKPQAGWRR